MNQLIKDLKGSSETTRGITKLDKNWYHWLVGFLEGDGSFFIRSNNTLGFEISQKTIDPILYKIKSKLGVGRVVHNSVNGVSRFVYPSTVKNYIHLINTIKLEDIRLVKRHKQYSNWIIKACSLVEPNIPIPKSTELLTNLTPPKLTDSWLSGFIDAEGSFMIGLTKASKPRPIFRITQDEKEIIEKIKSLFKRGETKTKIYKDRNTYVLAITSKKGREMLINYLHTYPLKTRKILAFSKWEECHKLLEIENPSPKDKERMNQLRNTINKFS